MKVKKISVVLLIAFFITNTVTTVFASGNLVSNQFFGRNSKQVLGRDFKVSIERGKQEKVGNLYQWQFTAKASYGGKKIDPDKFEYLAMFVEVDRIEQEINKQPEYKKKLINKIIRYKDTEQRITVLSSETGVQRTSNFTVSALASTYKPGSIRARIVATLKMKNNPQYHRIEATTKSKFWYPWNESTWNSWVIKKNNQLLNGILR